MQQILLRKHAQKRVVEVVLAPSGLACNRDGVTIHNIGHKTLAVALKQWEAIKVPSPPILEPASLFLAIA